MGLSSKEQKANEAYINDGYSEMNSCLQTKRNCTPVVQEQISILKEHLSGFFVPARTILYRGNGNKYPSLLKELNVDETFTDAAFVSTGLDPKVAKKFTHAVFDIIEVPEGGVTGKRVRSKLYDEREGRPRDPVTTKSGSRTTAAPCLNPMTQESLPHFV